ARQAIKLRPVDADPYDSEGDIFAHFGELDSAVLSYEKASDLRPGFSSARIGCIRVLQRDYATAQKHFLKVASVTMQTPGYFASSLILLHQGKINAAKREAQVDLTSRRHKLSPEEIIRALWLMLITSYELGDWEKMISIAAESAALERAKSWALAAGGKSKEAYTFLEKLYNEVKVKYKATEITNDYNLGIVAFHEGNYSLAAERFGKASNSLVPKRYSFYFYGVSLLKSGKTSKAIKELQLATWNYAFYSSFSNNGLSIPQHAYWPISCVKAHYWLGVAYERLSVNENAIKEYETFLETWKNADFPSSELKDANERLSKLKYKSQQ
ncbi:MAG: tetratricopeptide repeat protein, partial [Ignavibacteriales bacterium]|nr:tetratricopeptide repeat protein [Ignavibacteriales bacterium]